MSDLKTRILDLQAQLTSTTTDLHHAGAEIARQQAVGSAGRARLERHREAMRSLTTGSAVDAIPQAWRQNITSFLLAETPTAAEEAERWKDGERAIRGY